MFGANVRHVKIIFAIIVIINIRSAHSRAIGKGVALDGDVRESGIAVVAVKGLAPEVVHYIKIGVAIIIEVSPHCAQAQSFFADTCLLSDVGKSAVPVVVVKLVGFSIASIKSGGDIFARVKISADIQIEKSIIVVIGPCGYGGAAVFANARLLCNVADGAIAIVVEQLVGLEGAAYEKVFMSIVVVVGEYSHAYTIQASEASLFCHIFKRAIAPVTVELRFHSVRNEKVIEAVIIVINSRDSSWPVADHAKPQRLGQEGWVKLVLKIYPGFAGHVDEMRALRINTLAFDQLVRGELKRTAIALPGRLKIGPVNACPLCSARRANVLKAQTGNHRIG